MGDVPKGPALPFALRGLSWATWNTRGLFAVDPKKARLKNAYLQRLLASTDCVVLQETHGTDEAWDRLITQLRMSHLGFLFDWP